MTPRLLCVDDEPQVLHALRRVLSAEFEVDGVESPIAAMGRLATRPGYAVVLSDLRMPAVDGITLLRRARDLQPDAARILLTGHADLDSAVRAVNEGALHVFLTKPCGAEQLIPAIRTAVEGHAARRAEREVLHGTVSGAVRTLVDLLALGSPRAYARAERITQEAFGLISAVGMDRQWELEVGAMLSQIASITLPDDLLDRLHRGQPLSRADRVLYHAVPERGAAMVSHIPRMDAVADMIRYQLADFDGGGTPGDGRRGHDLPVGARVLRIAIDADALRARDVSSPQIVHLLRRSRGAYDPDLLEALAQVTGSTEVREVMVGDLAPGLRLEHDVHDPDGALLIGRGVVLNDRLLALLRNRLGPAMNDVKVLIEAR